MVKAEVLRRGIRRVLNNPDRFNQDELDACDTAGRIIGYAPVLTMRLRINYDTIPPTVYFDFTWDGEISGQGPTSGARNNLRRGVKDLIHQLQSYYKFGQTNIGRNMPEVHALISRSNNEDEKRAKVVLSGQIEKERGYHNVNRINPYMTSES